jgi:hypothetical protein
MADGEEEKAAPMSPPTPYGHGGHSGDGRNPQRTYQEEKKKVVFANDAQDNEARKAHKTKKPDDAGASNTAKMIYVPKHDGV